MYGKIFVSMYEGSLVGAGAVVYAVWGYCIAKADRDSHTVMLNPALLGAIIGEPADNVAKAIDFLCQPDKASKNQAHEGRRLLSTTGLEYLVVSHEIYRDINCLEDKRQYEASRKRDYRGKMSQNVPDMSRTEKDVPDNSKMSGTPVYVSSSVPSSSPDLFGERSETATDTANHDIRFDDPAFVEAYNGYTAYRKRKGGFTARAKMLILSKLEALAPGNTSQQVAILDQSVANGWTGLHPIGGQSQQKRNYGRTEMTKADMAARQAEILRDILTPGDVI